MSQINFNQVTALQGIATAINHPEIGELIVIARNRADLRAAFVRLTGETADDEQFRNVVAISKDDL